MSKVLMGIWIVNSLLITLLLVKANRGTNITVNHVDSKPNAPLSNLEGRDDA